MKLRKPFTKHVYPRLLWVYDRSPAPMKRIVDGSIGKIIPKPASDYEIDTLKPLAKSGLAEITREPGLSFVCEVAGRGGAFERRDLVLAGPGGARVVVRADSISPRAVRAGGPVFSRYEVDIPPEAAKGTAGVVRVETAEGEPLAEIRYDRLDWEFAHIPRLIKAGRTDENGIARAVRDVAPASANLISAYFGRSPDSKSLARTTFLWIDLLIDQGEARIATDVAFRVPHGDLMARFPLDYVEAMHRLSTAVEPRLRRRLRLKLAEDGDFVRQPFHQMVLTILAPEADPEGAPMRDERLQLDLERFARRCGFSAHAIRLTATIADAHLPADAAWETRRRILRDYYFRYR